jgi:NAD(P)-dependent dehydrogenase (short-subunit alcohol dehydrogenase family)
MEKRGHGVICQHHWHGRCRTRATNTFAVRLPNAALMAFTQGLGGGTVRQGVRVFGINPSPTRSDRMQGMLQQQADHQSWATPPRWHRADTLGMPFGRLAEPDEIAKLAVFCASSACAVI